MKLCNTLTEANELLDYLIQKQIVSQDVVEKALEKVRSAKQNKTPKKKKKKKKPKKDPFANCRMRHIALQIAYDGGPYNGFAENVGSADDHSVEKYLFEALVKCCLVKDRASSCYTRCGRTDKGVSAFGQIIGLKVRSAIPLKDGKDNVIEDRLLPNNSSEALSIIVKANEVVKKKNDIEEQCTSMIQYEAHKFFEMEFCQMLNNVLPEEIRAIGWAPVTDDFSVYIQSFFTLFSINDSDFFIFDSL